MGVLDYVKTIWVNDSVPDIDATNLNHLEAGVETVSLELKRRVQYVTPAQFALLTPADGDEVVLRVDDAAGVRWRLRYNAASASAYKWEFLGGPFLSSYVTTFETKTGTTYAALTTPGPSVTVPLAGDYEVELGCYERTNTAGTSSLMGYDLGATPASDSDSVQNDSPSASNGSSVLARRIKLAVPALTALVAKYRVGSGSGSWSNRALRVRPVRVG